jgi:hypothetical protein
MLSKYSFSTLIILVALLIIAPTAFAQKERPIQLSLFAPVQVVNENDPITGIRLNLLYGRNVYVKGLDWGLVNHTTTGVTQGVQFGFVGIVDADFFGWQDNVVNITKGHFEGFQWGFVNYANDATGFQLGIVNYARSIRGLQIGLVNIIKQGGQFPVFPIVNWSF